MTLVWHSFFLKKRKKVKFKGLWVVYNMMRVVWNYRQYKIKKYKYILISNIFLSALWHVKDNRDFGNLCFVNKL